MNMKSLFTLILALSALLTVATQAKIKVATLSPLIADLARQVGGDKVTVIDLIGTTGNPHSFQPTTHWRSVQNLTSMLVAQITVTVSSTHIGGTLLITGAKLHPL